MLTDYPDFSLTYFHSAKGQWHPVRVFTHRKASVKKILIASRAKVPEQEQRMAIERSHSTLFVTTYQTN